MSVNNSEEEYSTSRNLEEAESPRKRMRLDNASRKSWSLMDRKTDHEVFQEMGVSLLEPDDSEAHQDITHHHRGLKRKHNLENVNPNVVVSPRKSPCKASPHVASSSKHSPRSCEKSKPLTELDNTLILDCVNDEETPLGQSVSAQYLPPALAHGRQSYTPLGVEEEVASHHIRWEPSGADSFGALSDEVMLSVFRWLPKRTLAHCMLLCKKWYRVACDETLWQRLDLGNKTLSKGALGRILARKPIIVRLASSEIGEWRPTSPPEPSRIQYLDLSMAAIDLTSLGHLLERCPLLRKLSLESVQVEDSTCDIIGRCIHLETLNLTMSSGITAEGLAHILTGCTNLQSLNISWCGLTEPCLQVLVSQTPGHLQRLNLAGARLMTDDMVSALSARCRQLVELDLSDCSQLSACCMPAVCTLPALEHLALSRCYLLPAAALAKLSSMSSLQYLEVWGMLQSSSLSALRAALPAIQINQFTFSAIARPTVGSRRTSIWGLRTRD